MHYRRLLACGLVAAIAVLSCLGCGVGGEQENTPTPAAPATESQPATATQPAAVATQPPTVETAGATLELDKTAYQPTEEIQVRFTTPGTFPDDAWVGIIPSEVPHGNETANDENDLAYEYLEGRASGTLTFAAPDRPGSYDVRLHDTDDDGREVASVTFIVGEAGGPALGLDKTTFQPGEEFVVRFTTPSSYAEDGWVGIIPSEVPHGSEATNDEYDLDYEYLEGRVVGEMTFTAPDDPGSYDLRMHDTADDGQEVASVTITVAGGTSQGTATTQPPPQVGDATLELDKTTFQPTEEIQVRFSTPGTYPDDAWVGIIPSEVPHGSAATNDEHDLDYQYLEGQTSGVLTFLAPDHAGSYDVRLHDTDDDGREVASVTFTVGEAGGPTLELDKTTFRPGEEFVVRFTAPSSYAEDGWVGIIPSEVPHGSEATNDEYDLDYEYLEGRAIGEMTFTAPDEPGSYDLRMHDTADDGQEVVSVTFEVKSQ